MELVLAIVAAAGLVWGAVVARRGSLLVAAAAFIALGYVLGPPLWTVHAGPIPLTIDRVLLLGLGAMGLWHWRAGRLSPGVMTGYDWLLIAALGYFTIRCALTGSPPAESASVKPFWKLVAAYWVPAAVYFTARMAPRTERTWRAALGVLAALGAFLSFTAFAEITHQWWAVFPRYISNPELGTHFGRARGPALNSASLGVFVTICFWAAWMLVPRAGRAMKVVLAGALVAMAGAVFFTYTRSTWMGLAAGLAFIPLWQLPVRWRVPAALGVLMCGAIGVVALGHTITDLKRKDTDSSAEHSVYQRASFVYVSMRMFRDAPTFGCGLGRFYDLKLPYLVDRSQQLELESLRKLDHHNTVLGVLVETGFVGCTLFLGLMAAWVRAGWKLARDASRPSWQQAQGLFGLATTITYLSSALFHDLTLSPTEHWLLFFSAGLSVGLLAEAPARAVAVARQAVPTRRRVWRPFPLSLPRRAGLAMTLATPTEATTPKMSAVGRTVRLFGITIDALTMRETVDAVLSWATAPRGAACRFVVTPNVDHAVLFQTNEKLRAAYADAALVLADGAPVVAAARLLRRALPERVPGSDLAPALFKRVAEAAADSESPSPAPLRVFLLGAGPGVAERAAANIVARWPGVEVVGTLSPPLGFERDPVENERILAAVSESRPDVLLVGFGAPKQELWVHANADRLEAKVALCIGATIDFLAGEKRRAPRWMRRVGLEWLHRLSTEPRRLAKRYLRDAWIFPQLVWRDWRGC